MNIEQAIEHGRAWVAAGWIWERGQVAIANDNGVWRDYVVVRVIDGRPAVCFGLMLPHDTVPDMRNRGTLGHALGQVRDAWGSPGLYVAHDEPSLLRRGGPNHGQKLWRLLGLGSGRLVDERYASEAEALLAARRAAP